MKHYRLVLLALCLSLVASLATLVTHSTPKSRPVATVAVAAAERPSEADMRLLRASRSRLYVPTKPPVASMSPKAVHPPHHLVTVVSRPAPQAVRRVAAAPASSVGGGRYSRLADVTMYCDTGSRNAAGRWPQPGDVAVLDRSIPFGTRVTIEGLGTYTVEDWVGHGTDFDIFTHSCGNADQFGRHHLRVSF